MTITTTEKTEYTFPVVVPPVVNKAAVLHNSLANIWTRAMEVMSSAEAVIVFGYSCPQADQESANLITRTLRNNAALDEITIIDPSTAAFDRFADLSKVNVMHYYRSARAYLQKT